MKRKNFKCDHLLNIKPPAFETIPRNQKTSSGTLKQNLELETSFKTQENVQTLSKMTSTKASAPNLHRQMQQTEVRDMGRKE